MSHARAPGTSVHHARGIKDYQTFAVRHKLDPVELSEEALLLYITELHYLQKSYSFLTHVKGSIMSFLASMKKSPAVWTLAVQRIYEGALRMAAMERVRCEKVEPLPAVVIDRMVKYVWSFASSIDQVYRMPGDRMRATLLVILQYYTLSRCHDVLQLKAGDLALVSLDGVQAVQIFYKTAKNDQLANGAYAYIVSEGGPACPAAFIKAYYMRMGFYFQDSEHNDCNALFPRLRIFPGTDVQVSDGAKAVSESTLIDNLRMLCYEVGYEGKISGKSAKISGVSDSFKAGLSDADVRDKGRWKSLEVAQYYRRISPSHRLRLAQSTSIQKASAEDQQIVHLSGNYATDIQSWFHLERGSMDVWATALED